MRIWIFDSLIAVCPGHGTAAPDGEPQRCKGAGKISTDPGWVNGQPPAVLAPQLQVRPRAPRSSSGTRAKPAGVRPKLARPWERERTVVAYPNTWKSGTRPSTR